MFEHLRAGLRNTALGPAVVIWGFGYVLVDIFAFLIGRSALGLNLLLSVPMFLLGVCQTFALDRFRTGLHAAPPPLRWTLLIIGIASASAVQTLFDLHWLRWISLTLVPSWQEWALDFNLQRLFTVGILYLWTFCLALTLLWAGRISGAAQASAARAARAEAAAAKAEASQHQAEATALRLQLNPHFLFNALNSITSLVTLGRKTEAEEMIDRLCGFLRASLNDDPMADVSLGQEIESIDAYLGIEEARFGERLQIEISVDPAAIEAQVPNFILQPLVENAIKHGVGSVKGPASVAITVGREGNTLVLSVFNTSPAAIDLGSRGVHLPGGQRSGIGLANIRHRLANRYGEGAWLETGPSNGGYLAVIRLPYVEECRPQPRELVEG